MRFFTGEAGFTLLELIIVLAIVAILTCIALPAYHFHLLKVRRAEGQTALFHLAAAMEKFAIANKGYQDATLHKLNMSETSLQGYYALRILQAETAHFLIAATPQKAQQKDVVCGTLAMNDKGEKGKLAGNTLMIDKNCW